MECVDGHHDEVVAACGNYTDADKEHPGFPIHYYCGVGWSVTSHSPEHSAEHSTLYCDGFKLLYIRAFVDSVTSVRRAFHCKRKASALLVIFSRPSISNLHYVLCSVR